MHTANPDDFTNDNRKADISEAISFGSEAVTGEYILTVTATDSHDNVAAESVSIHVQETNPNAPVISIHHPTDGTKFSPEEVITLEAHIQDESALASVIIQLSDPAGETHILRTLQAEDFTNGPQKAHISESVSLDTTPGNYIITIEATDTEGNTSDKSVSVVVRLVDTTLLPLPSTIL